MPKQPDLRLMAVHAHPDDEVISTGGTYLHYADEGLSTVLVCCTGGEEGENHDPDLDPVEAQPRLAEIRAGELRCASAKLRIGTVEMLGYRDSGMADTPANQNPACFHQAHLDEATARLVKLIRRHRPNVLVSYNAFGFYGHPDHIKAYQITRAAFDRAADPTFAPSPNLTPWQPLKLYETAISREGMRRWRDLMRQQNPEEAGNQNDGPDPEKLGTPDEQITTRIDVRRFRDARLEALRCHRTQIPADSFFFKPLPEGVTEDLFGYEEYVLARSLVKGPPKEDDLFAGLR
ncbi:MAG: PIG-L family deacetylase [Chloroflexota bacterium]